MRELLKSTYPIRFCIPSETEIKQEISRLFQGSKKTNLDDDNDTEDVHNDNIVQENSTGIAVNRHSSWEFF